MIGIGNGAPDHSQQVGQIGLECLCFLGWMDQKGYSAVRFVATSDGDRLADGRKADVLQDLDRVMRGLLLEDSQAHLFLHYVDGDLGAGLRKALSQGLLDLPRAIGAADSTNLNGVDSGAPALVYFRHR